MVQSCGATRSSARSGGRTHLPFGEARQLVLPRLGLDCECCPVGLFASDAHAGHRQRSVGVPRIQARSIAVEGGGGGCPESPAGQGLRRCATLAEQRRRGKRECGPGGRTTGDPVQRTVRTHAMRGGRAQWSGYDGAGTPQWASEGAPRRWRPRSARAPGRPRGARYACSLGAFRISSSSPFEEWTGTACREGSSSAPCARPAARPLGVRCRRIRRALRSHHGHCAAPVPVYSCACIASAGEGLRCRAETVSPGARAPRHPGPCHGGGGGERRPQ